MKPIRLLTFAPCRLRNDGADALKRNPQPRRRSSHGSPARLSW